MEVIAEVHVPGLDMHANRWTYHLIFMEEVHVKIREITSQASDGYQTHGRGTIYVTKQQWISVVKHAVEKSTDPFDCSYISRADAKKLNFGMAATGVDELIKHYDPESQLVLTVEHFPGGSLSVYVISPN